MKFTLAENLRNYGMRIIFLDVLPQAKATRPKLFCLCIGGTKTSVCQKKKLQNKIKNQLIN